MKPEIEKMVNDLNENCSIFATDCSGELDTAMFAEALYNANYRKIVWHKVADGDLPEKGKRVLCYTCRDEYSVGSLIHTKSEGDVWDLDNEMFIKSPIFVFAWMEIPKCEGVKQ